MTGSGFVPDCDIVRNRIVACREKGRCYSRNGAFCEQAAACEILDERCRVAFDDGCDGACSRCSAATNTPLTETEVMP